MTELINEKKCRDCAHHTGDACDNSNSDHYGHMLTPWHQACNVFADLLEQPEPKLIMTGLDGITRKYDQDDISIACKDAGIDEIPGN